MGRPNAGRPILLLKGVVDALITSLIGWVTIVGLPIAIVQLWLNRRQMHMAFEQTYVNRYWVIDDDRVMCSAAPQKRVQHAVRYLRLCEDELELMRLGFVSWRTWDVWHQGILQGVQADEVEEALAIPEHHSAFEWVRSCIRAGHHHAYDCPGVISVDIKAPYNRRRRRAAPSRVSLKCGVALRALEARSQPSLVRWRV